MAAVSVAEAPLDVTQVTPVAVRVADGATAFGANCPKGSVLRGVAVGGSWIEPVVVTDQTGECEARRVTLSSRKAIVIPQLPQRP